MGKSISDNLTALRRAVFRGSIQWQNHALRRMIERSIRRGEVKEVLLQGILIEDYPGDYPFPSGLFLALVHTRPLHVVASYDPAADIVYIITAYEPGPDRFEADYKTRRKKP